MPQEQIGFKLPKRVKTAREATDLAIKYQSWASDENLSYAEVIYYQNYFEALAKKFNLTDAFKENGII